MTRLRDQVTLKNVLLSEIKVPETPPDEILQESLFEEQQKKPVELRPIDDPVYKYEIIDGRRRFLSLLNLEAQTVLAEIWFDVDDTEFHKRALIGNSGKPNPIDEADHMLALKCQGYTQESIGKLTGYSPGRISTTIKIAEKLHPNLKVLARQGKMNISACVEATKLPYEEQEQLNGNLSYKTIFEKVREWQSSQLSLFDDEEKINIQGLFLSFDQMEKLSQGKEIEIEWNEYKGVLALILKGE